MPFNGSGTFTLAQAAFVPNTPISSSAMNSDLSDIATNGLTNAVTKDGQTTITGAFKGANGSVGLPMYSFASDTNIGMYRHGADELGFSTAGTLAGYFNSAQKFFMLGAADIAGALGVTGVATFSSTSHMVPATGTTGQRPGSPAESMFRYNSTTHGLEFYSGSSWVGVTPTVTIPEGRLTLTTGVAVIATNTTAQSTVYYTPYNGNQIPIYDGTVFVNQTFAELSMVMSGANFAASAIYDLFVVNDAGTIRLGIGPVWTTLTAGAGARGTGAGTTELQRINGIWTNKVTMTLRYASASTVSIAANQATYVGTMFMDGTNSQVSCYVAAGQSMKFGIWNAYNRVPIVLKVTDITVGGTDATTSFHALLANTANSLTTLCGLPEEWIDTRANVSASPNASMIIFNGIGWNSTSAASGKVGETTGSASGEIESPASEYLVPPSIGVNVATHLFKVSTGTATIVTAEAGNLLLAKWNG